MQNETLSSETRQKIEDFIGVSIPKIRLPIREGSYTQYVLSHTEGIVTDDPSEIQRWMLEFTETTFLPNVLRAPIRAIVPRIFHLLGIRSTMTIPLVTSGQTIGLMDFSSAKRFTGEDLQRMLPISRQMTAILLRKQAESKVEVQLRRITALNDIDRTIGSSFDMRLSLEVLLKEVVSQLEVDAADVLLINPVGMSLEYVAGKGFRTTNIRRSRLKLGQGLAGKVGLQQKILHIPNLRAMEDEFIRSPLLKGEGFVEYFGVPLLAKGALKGVLEIFNRTPLHPDPDWMNYLETLGGQAAIAVDNAELFESMQRSNQELAMAYDATIAGWSRAMDLRDKETEGHTQRVTELTTQLAERMGVDARELVHIRRGALLHDIGKLGVPDSILLKPAKLTDEEWEVMRQHPRYAYEMLLPINYLHPALDIPFAHHEKWDGSGYPRKLKAEQIPLAARIFAVVDVWDALRSDRPYREKWSVERTREYILEQSGKYFDPRVVNEFMRMLDEMPELNP
ncbi:MAG: HD domain-containing protein [Chloroflexi bacterium CFX2]|nr:HD domain-containing protein [Chloroflexi bacterium CFX2]